MILVVTVLLLALVLIFVGYPLARLPAADAPAPISPALEQREQLLVERENALDALKDLEFEHSIGNLSDGDYAALQGAHRHKAVAILSELDSVDGASAMGSVAGVSDEDIDARLEEEIARVRQRLAAGEHEPVDIDRVSCPTCGASQALAARFCTACGGALIPIEACPTCGAPRSAADKFCAGCGQRFEQGSGQT